MPNFRLRFNHSNSDSNDFADYITLPVENSETGYSFTQSLSLYRHSFGEKQGKRR